MSPQVTVHLLRLPGESRRAARSALRELLATRLGCPIAEVSIRTDSRGKPHLIGRALEFSLAHRGPWCAVVFSPSPVGIDVEVINRRRSLEDVLAGFAPVVAEFFPEEAALEFAAAPVASRPSVFLRWWTRLEAAVKACGGTLDEGISCLRRVQYESFDGAHGLVLSVATLGLSAPHISWPHTGETVDTFVPTSAVSLS